MVFVREGGGSNNRPERQTIIDRQVNIMLVAMVWRWNECMTACSLSALGGRNGLSFLLGLHSSRFLTIDLYIPR